MESCAKAFLRRPTNLARPYPELCTWKAEVISVTEVVNHALHLQLLLLRAGDIKPKQGLICSRCSKSIHYEATPPSAPPTSGTSTQPAVASPDHKRVLNALSISTVPGVQLHYHLQRPSPVLAYCHIDVYSTTQIFHTASVPSCVNSVPTTHTGSALVYPVMWPTHPGCILHIL